MKSYIFVVVLCELVLSFFILNFAVVLVVVVVRVVDVIIHCITITTNTHHHRYLTFLTQLELPIYHFLFCFAYNRSVTVFW